jgi:hypothetical protein
MKNILKEIKKIMISGIYDEYRLIISNNHIELKLRPIKDNVEEVNFYVENNKQAKLDLHISLKYFV